MKHIYALVDVNGMYAACEQVFNPKFRHMPLIVLSNNDGYCIALSSQAKALGLSKFRPYFELKPICDKFKVVVCSSNFALYLSLSEQLMNTIRRFSPRITAYSVDEAFLDLSGISSVHISMHGDHPITFKSIIQ